MRVEGNKKESSVQWRTTRLEILRGRKDRVRFLYSPQKNWDVAQWLEQVPYTHKAASSNLATPTKRSLKNREVFQLEE